MSGTGKDAGFVWYVNAYHLYPWDSAPHQTEYNYNVRAYQMK